MSDYLRIRPQAALILQRDDVSSLSVEEGKKERQILQAILARPEFQYNRIRKDPVQWPSQYREWFYGLLRKIARLMASVFGEKKNRLTTSASRQGLLSWLSIPWVTYGLLASLAIAMLVLLARFGQSLTLSQEEGEVLPQQHDLFNLPDPLKESPQYWAEQADILIVQGKTREAFRSLYLALLVGFHRLNYIDFHRCRTNWSYLTHFRGDPQARTLFQELTQSFDLVWYGHRPLPAADYQRYKQAVRGALNV